MRRSHKELSVPQKDISIGITAFLDMLGFGDCVQKARTIADIDAVAKDVRKIQSEFDHNPKDTPAEEGGYVVRNPETGTTTQGETVEAAIANLQEATELYLSEFLISAPGHPLVTTFSVPAHA